MKKTLTINLNGTVFNIDEDAYELLESYLRNLRHSFRREEGSVEIMSDIEARIEELFSNYVRLGHAVINIHEVETVIAQMGQPADFGMDDSAASDHANEPAAPTAESAPKKFYRDADDKLIAGICSGLASYFNSDVLPIRIIAIILLCASVGWISALYLLVWIFVPEAKTAEEKLKMRGQAVTVENIGKIVSNAAEEAKRVYEDNKSGCLGGFVNALAGFFKICLIIFGCLVGIPLLIFLAAVVVALIAALIGVGTGVAFLPFDGDVVTATHPILASVGLFLLIIIPVASLLYVIIAYLGKWKPVSKTTKWTGLIAWIAALSLVIFSGIQLHEEAFKGHIGRQTGFTQETVEGNGIIAERRQSLTAIEALEIAGGLAANVQVEQVVGDSFALVIRGDSNILTHIDVKTTGHTLTLRTQRRYNLDPSTELIIRLQTPGLKRINVSGAAKVNLAGNLDTEAFEVDANGASHLTINDLHTKKVDVEASGASHVNLLGEVATADYEASGASHIYAFDLVAGTVKADAGGASKIECNPTERLDAEASGASQIRYKQEPTVRKEDASGASSIGRE
jgi:phage shock protein PspC (stress-responsive transcriptional regulator)